MDFVRLWYDTKSKLFCDYLGVALSKKTVPAPPVNYRTDGKIQMYPRNTIANTMIKDTCTVKDFKAKKCVEEETGYKIEWPYMQMTDKSVQVKDVDR